MEKLPEFAEEYTKKERIKLYAQMVVSGSIVVLIAKLVFLPWFNQFIASLASAPCLEIAGIRGATWVWYVIFIALPFPALSLIILLLGHRGMKVLRDKQYPPIGQKVHRPTRIRRGKTAQCIGWLHLLMILPFLAFQVWGSFEGHAQSERTNAKLDCSVNKNELR